MHAELKKNKVYVRMFLQNHMGDEELAMTLAHAQSGRMSFHSCDCLIGMATIKQADHAPQGRSIERFFDSDGSFRTRTVLSKHYTFAKETLSGALAAEQAFKYFGRGEDTHSEQDAKRCRILIPIIRAEMKRRDFIRGEHQSQEGEAVGNLEEEQARA
jgi:hypothetical protein